MLQDFIAQIGTRCNMGISCSTQVYHLRHDIVLRSVQRPTAGYKLDVYHTFHAEVREHQKHHWRCVSVEPPPLLKRVVHIQFFSHLQASACTSPRLSGLDEGKCAFMCLDKESRRRRIVVYSGRQGSSAKRLINTGCPEPGHCCGPENKQFTIAQGYGCGCRCQRCGEFIQRAMNRPPQVTQSHSLLLVLPIMQACPFTNCGLAELSDTFHVIPRKQTAAQDLALAAWILSVTTMSTRRAVAEATSRYSCSFVSKSRYDLPLSQR